MKKNYLFIGLCLCLLVLSVGCNHKGDDILREQNYDLETQLTEQQLLNELSSDFVVLYQQLMVLSGSEGALITLYNQWLEFGVVNLDRYRDFLISYDAQAQQIDLQLGLIIDKLNSNPELVVDGIPEELDSLEELTAFKDLLKNLSARYIDGYVQMGGELEQPTNK